MGKSFYKNTAAIVCLLIAVFCFRGSAPADMREADLFEKAYGYYLAFNPEKALETFDLFLQQFPESSALDSILFWRAKSLMQMKRVDEAARGFRKLKEVFPESSYTFYAEKELETLKGVPQMTERADTVREKTTKTSDAKKPDNEDRIRRLETEKIDLDKQLADAEKNRQLTEKGLSKALDDKNALESQIDELRRNRDELARKTTALEKGSSESSAVNSERTALESRLKVSEEKVAVLSRELAGSKDTIAALSKELSGKTQQNQKDLEKLDLHIKELKADNATLGSAVKEKERILAESHQTILDLKKNVADSQASKQQDIESVNKSISRLSAEKQTLIEETANEKKKAEELLVRLREKDEALQRSVSEASQRKAADAAAQDRLRQRENELANALTERDGLQSKIRALETCDRERNDLALQADDTRKLREDTAHTSEELARLQKENVKLLEEKRALGVKLNELNEQGKALAVARDKDADKERNTLLTKSQDLEKKLGESDARLRQSISERQKLDAETKERDQKLTKALDSVALLEKRARELEKEKESSSRALNDKSAKSAQERADIEEELKKERKKTAELTVRNAERDAALQKESKTLEQVKKELQALDREKEALAGQAAEAKKSREEFAGRASQADKTAVDNKRLLEEKKVLEKRLRDADDKVKAMLLATEGDKNREIKAFSEKLLEAEKKQKDSDLALKKSNEEKQIAEARLQQDQAQLKKSQESIALLERTLKGFEQEKEKKIQELSERIRIVEAEKKNMGEDLAQERRRTAELSGKGTEKETALLNNVKSLEISRKDLEARLAAEKTQREADLKKFDTERAELRNRLKDLEPHAVKAKDASAQLEDSRKKQDELVRASAAAEKEITRLKTVQAELESKLAAAEEKAKNLSAAKQNEGLALQDKQRAERQVQEREAQTAKDRETIALLEKRLKVSEQEKTEGLQSLNEKAARTVQEKKQLEAALAEKQSLDQSSVIRMQNELAEMKKTNELYAKKNSSMEQDLEALKTRMREYEKPFVRIGHQQYSLASVLGESLASRNVTDKIQIKNVPWRTGNSIDDFIIEQSMMQKAAEEGFNADVATRQSLSKQFALSAAEEIYLARYLLIDTLYRIKASTPVITEKAVREYYEKHKDQYIDGRENRIRLLSVKYGKTDELDKSLLAVEIHQEAQEGRPFESIAKKRAAVVTLKEMPLSKLPDWARVKLAGLKEGEISDIISVNNELMIIQPMKAAPAYRSFEGVRKEIETKLSAERPERKQSVQDWVNALRRDAEFLK